MLICTFSTPASEYGISTERGLLPGGVERHPPHPHLTPPTPEVNHNFRDNNFLFHLAPGMPWKPGSDLHLLLIPISSFPSARTSWQ